MQHNMQSGYCSSDHGSRKAKTYSSLSQGAILSQLVNKVDLGQPWVKRQGKWYQIYFVVCDIRINFNVLLPLHMPHKQHWFTLSSRNMPDRCFTKLEEDKSCQSAVVGIAYPSTIFNTFTIAHCNSDLIQGVRSNMAQITALRQKSSKFCSMFLHGADASPCKYKYKERVRLRLRITLCV